MQHTIRITETLKLTALAGAMAALAACGHQEPLAVAPAAEADHPQSSVSLRPPAHKSSGTAALYGTSRSHSPAPKTILVDYGALDGPDAGTGIVRLTLAESNAADGVPDGGPGTLSDQIGGIQHTRMADISATAGEVAADGQRADARLPDTRAAAAAIVSDEQDFEAVSRRESIESDARRLVEQRASRVDFAPEALPERQGSTSVAHYALSFTNDVGNKVFGRFGSFLTQHSLTQRCAEIGGDYAAQQAFLDAGGPQKDKLLLDPDGDGFACGWTPYIYRSMLN